MVPENSTNFPQNLSSLERRLLTVRLTIRDNPNETTRAVDSSLSSYYLLYL
jgi:hypothetical protein